jgi:uncharacterized RDD family membrane protein YckC
MSCTHHPDRAGPVVRCVRCLRLYCRDCVIREWQFFYCLECRPAAVAPPASFTPDGPELFGAATPPATSPSSLAGAGPGRRLVALVIDVVVVGFALAILLSAMPPSNPTLAFLATLGLPLVYEALFVQQTGQTLGKSAVGLVVVSEAGGPPGDGRAWVRGLLKVVQLGCCGLPLLSVFLSAERRALHDLASGTRVVGADALSSRSSD